MTEFSINLEFAQRAFNGTSFNPERRGELFVKDFDDLLLSIKSKIFNDKFLETEKKQEIYERIAGKLKRLSESYLLAESRNVSVMIVGPAKFPVSRQQKVMLCRITRNITILKRLLSAAEEKATENEEKPVNSQDFKHFTVIENGPLNRYQILFGGKPAPEIIKNLKQNGFKWAPSQKACQRQIKISGKLAIKRFAEFMEDF